MSDNNASPTLLDRRLSQLQDESAEIAIYLTNGIRLVGTIVEFDAEAIEISGKNSPPIIVRSSIATFQRFVRGENDRDQRGEHGQRR